VVAELKTDFTVTMYDARGHGGTDAPETGYGIEDRATDLLGVLDALSITKPVVLGHSLGGSTAAWAAANNPGTLRGIILLDPAGIHGEPDIGPDERAEMVRGRVERHAEQSISELTQEYDEWSPELARRLAVADKECSPQVAKITAQGFPPLDETFEDIDCPTLVIRSDGSPTERADDLEVADNLQNGRLVHIHEAGHCIHRDRYDATMAEIETFLHRHS
jgi:pimeloyl-ACP methyl ester carboxylesterase